MKLGTLVRCGENLRILLVSQVGRAKWLASAPYTAASWPTFTYMDENYIDENWWTCVSHPDLQKSLLTPLNSTGRRPFWIKQPFLAIYTVYTSTNSSQGFYWILMKITVFTLDTFGIKIFRFGVTVWVWQGSHFECFVKKKEMLITL